MNKIVENKLQNVKIKYFMSNDVAFKTFFRKNHSMLKKVISMSIRIKVQEIKKLVLLNTELIKDTANDKLGILDLLVEINDNKKINIEIQNVDKHNFVERGEFYLSKLFVENIEEGEDYANLKHVYGIYFLNYDDKNYQNFYSVFENYDIMNLENTKTFKTMIIFNLAKIDKIDKYNFSEEEKDILRFIKSKNERELIKMAEKRISLNKAMKQLREINADKELKALLFHAEKRRLDELSEKKWKERMLKDREEIIKDRNEIIKNRDEIIKNRDEIIKNRDEIEHNLKIKNDELKEKNNEIKNLEQKQNETIINMLKDKLDVNIISKYTNVSLELILKIKNDYKI